MVRSFTVKIVLAGLVLAKSCTLQARVLLRSRHRDLKTKSLVVG